jgi:hypothetical protein
MQRFHIILYNACNILTSVSYCPTRDTGSRKYLDLQERKCNVYVTFAL